MKRSHPLILTVMLMVCAVLLGGSFPAFAQNGGTAAPAAGLTPENNADTSVSPVAVQAALTSAFTYQGNLKKNGQPANMSCAFQFSLWDSLTDGAQKGSTVPVNNVQVSNGLFTVDLDFGNQFTGDARWLQTAVQCAGDAGFTTLTPRQPLNAVPYAIGLLPGAQVVGSSAGTAGILRATNSGQGAALVGLATSATGTTYGVLGNAFSANGYAVWGYAEGGATAVRGASASSGPGVSGSSATGWGVVGQSTSSTGVVGLSGGQYAAGVYGENTGLGFGVQGKAPNSAGVVGESTNWFGVYGKSTKQVGVWGESTDQSGVTGKSQNLTGVWGETNVAHTYDLAGVKGVSNGDGGIGVKGVANVGAGAYGVYGVSAHGYGVVGQTTDGYAGYFIGKVGITGGADLAERFDVSAAARVEPGTLLVIDDANPGKLRISDRAYDTRVAGIVSGAGGVKPGLTLHQEGLLEGDHVVAIAGRVYVKAEADSAPIRPGDLLTTSALAGHAMKATDRERGYGAIIGKAMTGLEHGTGLVLVLVNLQ